MDKDLDFLITALSHHDSPLWASYSRDQLMDMRESFIMLQDLLRHKSVNVEYVHSHPMRFKAGGNTDSKPMSSDLPPTVPLLNFQFHAGGKPSMTSLASLHSLHDLASVISSTNLDSSSVEEISREKQDVSGQGDDETSTTENFLALVPYHKQEPSQELVLYEPPVEPDDDDDDDDGDDDDDDDDFDTVTLRGSNISISISGNGSESGARSSVGEISISIPVEMEYVWHNVDYRAESTDSDMTIIADGFNYILSN